MITLLSKTHIPASNWSPDTPDTYCVSIVSLSNNTKFCWVWHSVPQNHFQVISTIRPIPADSGPSRSDFANKLSCIRQWPDGTDVERLWFSLCPTSTPPFPTTSPALNPTEKVQNIVAFASLWDKTSPLTYLRQLIPLSYHILLNTENWILDSTLFLGGTPSHHPPKPHHRVYSLQKDSKHPPIRNCLRYKGSTYVSQEV